MKLTQSYLTRGLSMLALAAFLIVGLAACNGEAPDTPDDGMEEDPAPTMAQDSLSIVDIAISDARFTTLVSALDAAGLTETLAEDGPFTVFAPTDEAFEGLEDGALDDLLEDTDELEAVLLYHVVEGEIFSDDLEEGEQSVTTLQGDDLTVEVSDEGVMVGDAQVVEADIEAVNGVVHVIDGVQFPPE